VFCTKYLLIVATILVLTDTARAQKSFEVSHDYFGDHAP